MSWVLIVSSLALMIGIFLVSYSRISRQPEGIAIIVLSILVGFGVLGISIPVDSKLYHDKTATIEKNKNSIVVLSEKNRIITEALSVNSIEETDSVYVYKSYNSYGFVILTSVYVKNKEKLY